MGMYMENEFEDINSRIPDLNSALSARIAAKKGITVTPPPGTVDPYRMMLQRKRKMDSGDLEPGPIMRWPEEDVKALQEYCEKMGIVGFNSTLHPRIVLAQLKRQFGENYSGVPLDERIPNGFEKAGSGMRYNSSFPYSESMRPKQLLHG
jgi:hypothetical protein